MSEAEKNEKDIDYLHPDGKPENAKKLKSAEEYAIAEKQMQKSIDEADGHHMCSTECQKHHKV
ncbi:MAG TPA: hypothetical protein V6C76_17895 [Drouetiella sp.]